jgi:5-methylcytosine-specific restriction endonuclease McrA
VPKPPKRPPKSKRGINPQKEKHSRVIDADAIKAARRSYCAYCGISKTSIAYCVHHIVGRARGGGDVIENLICLCSGPGSNCCHERSHGRVVNDRPPITANDLKDMLAMDWASLGVKI